MLNTTNNNTYWYEKEIREKSKTLVQTYRKTENVLHETRKKIKESLFASLNSEDSDIEKI